MMKRRSSVPRFPAMWITHMRASIALPRRDYAFRYEYINSYTIKFGSDLSKAPIAWTLYGSNDKEHFSVIDSKSNYAYFDQQTSFVTIPLLSKQKAYQTYRIEFCMSL